ncbi:MAG: META domain-containing protein [Geminicoccaceae bacterium]
MPGWVGRGAALLAAGWILAGCGSMAAPDGPIPEGLAGSAWRAKTLAGQPVDDATAVTLEFVGSDRIAGKAACNRYNGPLRVADGRLQIGPLAATRMACPPPLMEAEAAFLAALEGAQRFTLENSALLLDGPAGSPPTRFLPFTPP